jgi:RNA polymerase sigma factor (sigma-70 family)
MHTTSVSLLEHLHDPTDQVSWRRLVDWYAPLLRDWLRRYALQDHDVEDLLQDIFSVLVRKLPEFHYDPERGSFRSWLRSVLAHCCQNFWRARSGRPQAFGGNDALERFRELGDADSELSRRWDREHDQHVAQRLLELVKGDFAPTTWKAFQRVVLDGVRTDEAAAELGMSVNAVLIAKSRVLRRLEQERQGFIDW